MRKGRQVAFLGMMLACIAVLGMLEQMLPPLPFLPPNVKPGLANIVTMYCAFFVGKKEAFLLAAAKSGFVLLIRGPMAACLSLSGGISSLSVIILCSFISKKGFSYLTLSIFGAITHNFGQILAVSALLGSITLLYYIPVLIVSGIIMGSITGVLLKAILPAFKRINGS